MTAEERCKCDPSTWRTRPPPEICDQFQAMLGYENDDTAFCAGCHHDRECHD